MTNEEKEWYEERAAILEFDHQMSREAAEAQAREELHKELGALKALGN